jgi:2'-5' RNA ligase
MSDLVALDVALLPPPEVTARAVEVSASLPLLDAARGKAGESQGLRLDADHLPHITLMQLFARKEELDEVMSRVDATVAGAAPLALRITGGGQGTHSVWMAVEKTPPLVQIHERLMESLRGLERPDGGTGAFADDDARLRDVLWVAGYRLKSSFHHFEPHITLGHGSEPPAIEPFSFEARTVAVCHLGKFCTCRRVLREWMLSAAGAPAPRRP